MTISIHALLAESDNANLRRHSRNDDFYPRSPCGERLNEITYQRQIDQFLSTLSLRRATFTSVVSSAGTTDFYPRSPCGERHAKRWNSTERPVISIHALLAESDALDISARRGANISIHALLAESDQRDKLQDGGNSQFLSTLSLRRAT